MTMKNVSYESMKAEHAWMVVSDQLQQRNNMLGRSISHLERFPAETRMAGRLTILRYHLKMSLRQLTQSVHQPTQATADAQILARQWQHVHQLFFLLRQIDTELGRALDESLTLRHWQDAQNARVYRSALVCLN
ncbi:hypothetical protein CLV58_11944 [Spirosoma oryzae]|uniref:Uncharacterized protein n=2 Tax=Spirosoma oryzae TaxID=1469603 RepID=A0A2T0SKG1_9BACT|nr:hypothetical protein CLV58_11944 [Spirosoma oryzae]